MAKEQKAIRVIADPYRRKDEKEESRSKWIRFSIRAGSPISGLIYFPKHEKELPNEVVIELNHGAVRKE